MNAVEVSTVVYAPREEIYDFLADFEGYARYSTYVEDVEQAGDGGPGTEYDVTVSWWELEYAATSEVTDAEPPERIDWRLVGGLDARGHWLIEEATDAADERPPGTDAPANRVVLGIECDPDSVSSASASLPAFVPVGTVLDRIGSHLRAEAESVVEDVVADLEGQRRDVDLVVRDGVGENAKGEP